MSFMPISGCGGGNGKKPEEIIVFHAGSLSVPFTQLKKEYEKRNPGIKVLLEPAGSLVCARKITELGKPCDIIASADYSVINELLIPEYTKWNLMFATNSIVIAYSDRSRYASGINGNNWMDILLRDDVIYSRSDPDSDPCGYRTVFAIMLTEKLTGRKGLTEKILSRNMDFIRPKEVDLVALVESDAADYMFQYKSVAIQHGLKYIELPDDVNLSDPAREQFYRSVSYDVAGKKPGSKIRMTGDYISYSLSVPESAPHKAAAYGFICFALSREGLEIFSRNGQKPINPLLAGEGQELPPELSGCIQLGKSN